MAKRKQAASVTQGARTPEPPRTKTAKAAQVKPARPKAKTPAPARPKGSVPKKAARPKSATSRSDSRVRVNAEISRRLREIRKELFGDQGGPELARRLDLPARTWYNYETGVSVPAEILLRFLEETGTEPWWVLKGTGPKYVTAKTP